MKILLPLLALTLCCPPVLAQSFMDKAKTIVNENKDQKPNEPSKVDELKAKIAEGADKVKSAVKTEPKGDVAATTEKTDAVKTKGKTAKEKKSKAKAKTKKKVTAAPGAYQ